MLVSYQKNGWTTDHDQGVSLGGRTGCAYSKWQLASLVPLPAGMANGTQKHLPQEQWSRPYPAVPFALRGNWPTHLRRQRENANRRAETPEVLQSSGILQRTISYLLPSRSQIRLINFGLQALLKLANAHRMPLLYFKTQKGQVLRRFLLYKSRKKTHSFISIKTHRGGISLVSMF